VQPQEILRDKIRSYNTDLVEAEDLQDLHKDLSFTKAYIHSHKFTKGFSLKFLANQDL